MNAAIQGIILLACTALCTPAAIKSCRCVKTINVVNPALISEVTEYRPRPYCNRHEVIVTLRDRTLRCLNPEQNFTKAVLKTLRIQWAAEAARRNTAQLNSTAAPTAATGTATAQWTASASLTATSS